MQFFIDLSPRPYTEIWEHLLPEGASCESAAFLFVETRQSKNEIALIAQDFILVGSEGFKAQFDDFIELSDEARVSIIKQAHRTNTALVELHSHPFNGRYAAAFSVADLTGFEETVPHMWWRLPNRPYAAIVVAPCGFDSLVWVKSPHAPEPLTALRVGDSLLKPTHMTLGVNHDF